jgi:hypothetical protein
MRRFLAVALLLGLTAACGGDGGTAPPTNVDLSGTWSITMSDIRGYGIECQVLGLQASIAHVDNGLSGSYSVADMVCNPGDVHSGPGGGQIVEGTAVNGALHFHFDSEDFDLHGMVQSATAVRGTYTLTLNVNGTYYTFSGSWVAHRQ